MSNGVEGRSMVAFDPNSQALVAQSGVTREDVFHMLAHLSQNDPEMYEGAIIRTLGVARENFPRLQKFQARLRSLQERYADQMNTLDGLQESSKVNKQCIYDIEENTQRIDAEVAGVSFLNERCREGVEQGEQEVLDLTKEVRAHRNDAAYLCRQTFKLEVQNGVRAREARLLAGQLERREAESTQRDEQKVALDRTIATNTAANQQRRIEINVLTNNLESLRVQREVLSIFIDLSSIRSLFYEEMRNQHQGAVALTAMGIGFLVAGPFGLIPGIYQGGLVAARERKIREELARIEVSDPRLHYWLDALQRSNVDVCCFVMPYNTFREICRENFGRLERIAIARVRENNNQG